MFNFPFFHITDKKKYNEEFFYFMDFSGSQMREDGSDAIRTTEIDGIYSFLSHVDWSERWLQGVIVFHILCFVVTVLTRSNTSIQAFLFVGLLAIVFFAENINEYAAMNYKYFSRLQYFDSGGLFISLVLCLPILVNCFIMLLFWLLGAGKMLVKVKKAKLIQRAHQERETAGKGDGDQKKKSKDDTAASTGKPEESKKAK